MLTNEPLRLAKAAAGLERAKAFSWDKCAVDVLALIERVANETIRWEMQTPSRSPAL
jgi:hypothetical protein